MTGLYTLIDITPTFQFYREIYKHTNASTTEKKKKKPITQASGSLLLCNQKRAQSPAHCLQYGSPPDFAFWVGNSHKLELAPFDTCYPTSRQSIAITVAHRFTTLAVKARCISNVSAITLMNLTN